MVICCVPKCGADSWRCDGSITFYDFPSSPDLAAKWIKQINTALKVNPMWFPRGKPVICSKHFLHTDFKGDTDSLNPRSIPTVFGHKYFGPNAGSDETNESNQGKTTPLIVKVIKPRDSVIENDSNLRILDVRSEINHNVVSHDLKSNSRVSTSGIAGKLHGNSSKNCSYSSNNDASGSKPTNDKQNENVSQQQTNSPSGANGIKCNRASKQNFGKQPGTMLKTILKKKEKAKSELIEISPNTFLKINPDIIKINKTQTPSGNTVLQFLMDQKLAKTYSSDLLPKLIQSATSSEQENDPDVTILGESKDSTHNKISSNQQKETVQHVLGHVVDNHACKKTLQVNGDNEMENSGDKNNCNNLNTSFIDKAPVLLTTNMPLNHCFIDKPKYVLQLKQKNRQIASLKLKVSSLNKKIEDLEDRCIVQERQLSYSFIKRLKSIRRNAANGDPRASYILEQIRSYSDTNNSKMRWSDSTLTQCAIWCRKAPYAYEYFRKADFFKLPCLGSVKRFIKKHPEVKFQKKVTTNCTPKDGGGDDDDESSDFDFEESDDGQNGTNEMSEDENTEPVRCETILSVPSEMEGVQGSGEKNANEHNEVSQATESIINHSADESKQKIVEDGTNVEKDSGHTESNGIPIAVDGSNLELQELVLPSGEVVQCYSSTIGNSADIGGQYYIIPNVGEQGSSDHEYSVIQADSLPVVLQNLETSQLHLQQDQLIFIANSTGQVECCETEVTSV